MIRILLSSFIAIVFVGNSVVYADNNKQNKWAIEYRYALYGVGTGVQNVSFLSPVYYNTTGLNLATGIIRTRGNWLSAIDHNVTLIMSTDRNDREMLSVPNHFTHSYALKLPTNSLFGDDMKLFLGLGYWLDVDFVVKSNNQNNPIYYNLNNMLSLNFRFQHRLGRVNIINELMVPFAGFYSASEFSSSVPYFALEDDAKFWDSVHFGSFSTNKQIANRLSFDIRYNLFGTTRTSRVSYELRAQNFELNNNLKHYVTHTLSFGILFNVTRTHYVHE